MGFQDDSDIATASNEQRMYSLVGTEEYLAPETLSDTDLSYACDYWSLGVILYQLLCGSTPFKGRSDLETYHNIQKCEQITFPKANIDEQAKDLIKQLLTKDPTQRIGFHDIEEIKGHPYFSGIDWATVRSAKVPYNPPQVRRPPRLQKPSHISNSFSKAPNQSSPLLLPQSPSSNSSSSANGTARPTACFGSAQKRPQVCDTAANPTSSKSASPLPKHTA